MTVLYRIFMLGLIVLNNSGKTQNNIFIVRVKAGAHYMARKLQELVEAAFKRMVTVASGVPLGAAGWYLSGQWFVGVIALLLCAFVPRIRFINEGVELRGQAVESWMRARDGEDYDAVELANGRQLAGGSYHDRGLFPGKSPEEIAAMLRKRRPWAARMGNAFGAAR